MMLNEIVYKVSNRVATIALDRPSKRNAITGSMLDSLLSTLDRAEEEQAVDFVVLSGTGDFFSAGADIGAYRSLSQDQFCDLTLLAGRVCDRIGSLRKLVIAAVNGPALGGGFELVLACDLVVATKTVYFSLPEAKIGLIPGWGGTQRLARAVGPYRCKEITMSGQKISAEMGHAWGLVNRVANDRAVIELASRLGEEIVGKSSMDSLASLKRVIDDGLDVSLSESLNLERDTLMRLFQSTDANEGLSAFVEKRTPSFQSHR